MNRLGKSVEPKEGLQSWQAGFKVYKSERFTTCHWYLMEERFHEADLSTTISRIDGAGTEFTR